MKFKIGDIVVKINSHTGRYVGIVEDVRYNYISGTRLYCDEENALIAHSPYPGEDFGDDPSCYKLFEEVSKVQYLILFNEEKPTVQSLLARRPSAA